MNVTERSGLETLQILHHHVCPDMHAYCTARYRHEADDPLWQLACKGRAPSQSHSTNRADFTMMARLDETVDHLQFRAHPGKADMSLNAARSVLAYKLCEPVTLYRYIRGKGYKSLQHSKHQQNKEQRAMLQVEGLP